MEKEVKVKDHPDYRRRGAGVVNVNTHEYSLALSRAKNAKRLDHLEAKVQLIDSKLDTLIELLRNRS